LELLNAAHPNPGISNRNLTQTKLNVAAFVLWDAFMLDAIAYIGSFNRRNEYLSLGLKAFRTIPESRKVCLHLMFNA